MFIVGFKFTTLARITYIMGNIYIFDNKKTYIMGNIYIFDNEKLL